MKGKTEGKSSWENKDLVMWTLDELDPFIDTTANRGEIIKVLDRFADRVKQRFC